ncbi:hypothetical protein BDEG_20456 [Batrachochytrium dendrobatidis JEL423]|uniref:Uncharacterized protein n=1 Tax=Batrachochytrium dendrobatidis (strain JEL423) TaxID=403673 RepID=A0A177W984_BATDL|nr:hypothetical protein BDEG_20456 [Batrachochytrium dendrobatidis JEL423]
MYANNVAIFVDSDQSLQFVSDVLRTMNGTMSNKFCCSQMRHTRFPWLQHFDSKLPVDVMLHGQQVAVSNSMLVVSGSCKPSTHGQLLNASILDSHSRNGRSSNHYQLAHVVPMRLYEQADTKQTRNI